MAPLPASARRLAALAAVACVAGLALCLPAGAGAFSWQFPVTPLPSGPNGSDGADVAVAPDGTTTIVYTRQENPFTSIRAATRPAGQSDFIYSDVSVPGAGSDNRPRIAVSPDGTTTVVWHEGGNDEIWVATRPPGNSTFPDPTQTRPQRLSVRGLYSTTPDVTAADDGSVTAVWATGNPSPQQFSDWRVQAAIRLPGQAAFGGPRDVSTALIGSSGATPPFAPKVAAAADGTTTAVWSQLNSAGGSTGTIQAATRRPGESGFPDPAQTPPADLSPAGEEARTPDVSVGINGETTVAWQGQDQSATNLTVELATRQAGAGTFGDPQEIWVVPPADGEPVPQVAHAPDGQTTVVWGYAQIFSSTRGATSSNWGPATPISDPPVGSGTNHAPKIAVASDGRATVAWLEGFARPAARVLAATRAGGSDDWSSPAVLDADPGPGGTGPFATPAIAVAPDGRATVAWTTKLQPPGTTFAPPLVLTIDSDATRYGLEVKTEGTGSGTITSSPAGISCGATCSSSFPLSTPVVLTANPSAGSSFAGWGGACSGSASTCTVRILGDRSVTATFTRNPPAPEPGPSPSNRFTTTPSTVRGSAILTRIRVPDAGKITQRATYSPRRASSTATRTACTASRTAKAAGTYTLVCRLNPAARAQRREGTLRLRLRTTFTPTGGSARSSVRTVLVRGLSLPVVG